MDEGDFKEAMGGDDPEEKIIFEVGVNAMIFLYKAFREGGLSRLDSATLVSAIVDRGADNEESQD